MTASGRKCHLRGLPQSCGGQAASGPALHLHVSSVLRHPGHHVDGIMLCTRSRAWEWTQAVRKRG